MRPPVTIVMTTWAPEGPKGDIRIAAAQGAVSSWLEKFKYDGELLLHVADDGSKHGDYGTSIKSTPCMWWPGKKSFSRQEARGVGASLNAGFKEAFKTSPFAIYLPDDWELLRQFDLRTYVDLLLAREDIGMVILGPPAGGTTGEVQLQKKGRDQWVNPTRDPTNHLYFLLLHRRPPPGKGTGYVFSHKPALYHKRFIDRWGWHQEDVGAQNCERNYNLNWLAGKENDIAVVFHETWRHIPGTEFALTHPPARLKVEKGA